MNFLAGVVRVMRANGIIRGDTDAPTTFSDLQHGATVQLAMIAIQDELTELSSDILLPYEKKTTGSITTVSGTRVYSLASDFVRFYGTAMLYCSADNTQIAEYSGGQDRLRQDIFTYKTDAGDPSCWYFEEGTTKQIGFFQVPNSAKTYTYDYEYDTSVTNTTDVLPFHTEAEAQTFCRIAARRFKWLYESNDISTLMADPERNAAKSTLASLVRGTNPVKNYAPVYR
jgi:hypothetical protein